MGRPSRWLVALLFAATLSALLPRAEPAHAATFQVTTTFDAPHTTPLDGNCTSTLPGAACTLRAAIQAANFLRGAHTINVPAGTYVLTLGGPDEQLAAIGDLDIVSGPVTIVGAGAAATIIDGN